MLKKCCAVAIVLFPLCVRGVTFSDGGFEGQSPGTSIGAPWSTLDNAGAAFSFAPNNYEGNVAGLVWGSNNNLSDNVQEVTGLVAGSTYRVCFAAASLNNFEPDPMVGASNSIANAWVGVYDDPSDFGLDPIPFLGGFGPSAFDGGSFSGLTPQQLTDSGDPTNPDWQTYEFEFVATDSSAFLFFTTYPSDSGNVFAYAAYDALDVKLVPEPGSVGLVLLSGILIGCRRRRS